MDFKRILLVLKIILQALTVLIKADPFLKKIHFKKVKKDHEEDLSSKLKLKWTTKFKTLTVSVKYMSPLLGNATLPHIVMSATWEPHSNNILQGTMVDCFPFQ